MNNEAEEFLKTGQKYQLGFLPTEQSHDLTKNLSELANHNLKEAFRVLKQVDLKALDTLCQIPIEPLDQLQKDIQRTLTSGGRIFLCGCGATGRLSLSLEVLWRTLFPQKSEQVIGFMAGGDVALVHALEGFEDFPEYGARHLNDLNFNKNDLLIASSEGGETPYVLGAVKKASEISDHPNYFIFCNPKKLLLGIDRSREVLENPNVITIDLAVGPMALSGSTRLQASTILMLAIGCCLLKDSHIQSEFERFRNLVDQTHFDFLIPFTTRESELYKQGENLLYEVDDLGITVFTDTTERAPTFNLPAFDNSLYPKQNHSLCYVSIPNGWKNLLKRDPHCLEWTEINVKTTFDYIKGFDFGSSAFEFRKKLTGKDPIIFKIQNGVFELQELTARLTSTKDLLFDQLLLKIGLNQHSTLVMGRLDRFENNFMTWVNPTNGKLIDRAARYVLMLLENKGINKISYNQVIRELFEQIKTITPKESIVKKTAEQFYLA